MGSADEPEPGGPVPPSHPAQPAQSAHSPADDARPRKAAPSLTEEELSILRAIHRLTRPTFDMLHRLVFPQMAASSLYEKLRRLRDLSLIAARPLRGSERYFVLRGRGARMLGIEKLSGAYSRSVVDHQFHLAGMVYAELDLLAERAGWQVAMSDAAAAQLIAQYRAEIALSETGVALDPHQVKSGIPGRILPDRVISTEREVAVVIVAHPHSEMAFWSRRLRRYGPIIHDLRFIFVPLTLEQRLYFHHALVRNEADPRTRLHLSIPPRERCTPRARGSVASGNFLILLPDQLGELPRYL